MHIPMQQIRQISIKVLLIIAMIAASGLDAVSQTSVDSLDTRTSLAGEWKFKFDDKPSYALSDYDDSMWKCIDLPGSISRKVIKGELQRISLRNVPAGGILWLRKEVFISKKLMKGPMGLILGRIADADETYFNGQKIGGTGGFPPDEFSMWNHPRHYLIPEGIIRHGEKNVISIRVSYYVFCEILGTLALTNYQDWNSDRILQNFFRITVRYFIIIMGIPIFFIFLQLDRRRRKSEYLYFRLQLLMGLPIILYSCNYWNIYGSTLMSLKILGFSWIAVNVAHIIFIHRIYGLKRRKLEIYLWCWLAISLVLLYSIKGNVNDLPIVFILIATLAPTGYYNIANHIYALYKKLPHAKLFSFFGIIVVIGAIHDFFVYCYRLGIIDITPFGYTFDTMIFEYTTAFLYTGAALVLIQQFVEWTEDNENLVASMENFLIERADLHEQMKSMKEKRLVRLSPQFEEKLEKIIEYLKDNYKDEVSREGLAATINLHPDNLSRLFIQYTGETIGNFINELRIREASRLLIETDESVINIALSVGFENLRTFNRIFRKFMNNSPDRYRKIVRTGP
jgi:AraC-like DNA-binding protein